MHGKNLLSEKIRALGACDFLRPAWLEAHRRAERSLWLDHQLNEQFNLVNDDMDELLEKLGHICMLIETDAQPLGIPVEEAV